jgi:hypothetical protein
MDAVQNIRITCLCLESNPDSAGVHLAAYSVCRLNYNRLKLLLSNHFLKSMNSTGLTVPLCLSPIIAGIDWISVLVLLSRERLPKRVPATARK